LKIELPNITPLALGNSDEVQVGQLVFAIGNPYGLQESVSQGIISAKGRKATSDSLVEAFQTDAAVNRGNSGGPLVNIRGEVIGVNSSIFSESGGSQGIAFAIPSNTVKTTVESVIKQGKVVRGYLGVTMQNVSPELASQVGASGLEGVMVEEVMDGSPADIAGVQPGDIIRKFNGKKIEDPVSLRNSVAQVAIDSEVQIEVLRNNQEKKLTAKIVEQPENFAAMGAPQRRRGSPAFPRGGNPAPRTPPNVPPPAQALAGISVTDTQDQSGVMIGEVQENSPAASKLQEGDIIMEINRSQITSVDEYRALVSTLDPSASHVLRIARGRQKLFVVIPPR
jgi:serine protease Do